ncbi:MAG: thiamine pyrophosphate-binding protein [Patescibacteria group bacterium]|nr:thiamine pyrophosphate-binding protein [Patescibacteria group bacterium]
MVNSRQFLTGSEVFVRAAIDSGAGFMFGYPITPASEILSGWINSGKKYLQTEDEIAAGFALCGAVLGGEKAFTATSGPGNILMQDGLSMAEGMRLPFVMVAAQRGGPSSGTVIYSQQEVILSCFGGNGEGMRFVYSPSNLSELYKFTRKAFNDAWHYRFPAIILTDGYLLKTKGVIDFAKIGEIKNISPRALVPKDSVVHWPNIYTFEEELYQEIKLAKDDFEKVAEDIADCESYQTDKADILLVAHGIVGAAAKEAVDELRKKGINAGLFRPITLRPLARKKLDKIAGQESVKKIVVVESSLGQLARIIRDQIAPEICAEFAYMQYPGLGIETEAIVDFVAGLRVVSGEI